MAITHINPPSLFATPVFSQGTVTPAGARTLYVGGQNGVDASGQLVGESLAAQTEQAMKNVLAVLNEAAPPRRTSPS